MRITAAVLTVSDRCSRGEAEDKSGPAVAARLTEAGFAVVETALVPDEAEAIQKELVRFTDERKVDLVFTTGGTGFSPRDVTPEATAAVIERETPFFPQAMLVRSLAITPNARLSRMKAGIRGQSLILNLPGSPKAATENLEAVVGTLPHALKMLRGEGHGAE